MQSQVNCQRRQGARQSVGMPRKPEWGRIGRDGGSAAPWDWHPGRRDSLVRIEEPVLQTFPNICLFEHVTVDSGTCPSGCELTICVVWIFRKQIGPSLIVTAAASVCFRSRRSRKPATPYSSAAASSRHDLLGPRLLCGQLPGADRERVGGGAQHMAL